MTDEPQFKSRRELREAEAAGLVSAEPVAFDSAPRVASVSVPVEPTGQPLTRRQLRELEKTGGILAIHTSQIELPQLPAQTDEPAETPSTLGADPIAAEREEPMTVANPVVMQPTEPQEVAQTQESEEPQVVSDLQAVAQPTAVAQRQAPARDERATEQLSEAARKALADAAEFESILSGAVAATASGGTKTRRRAILLVGVALLLLGGLAIAASVMGFLK